MSNEFKIRHLTIRPSDSSQLDGGYECPCCGDFRRWKEGKTECKNCGAHLQPSVKVFAHGIGCEDGEQ